MTTITETIHEGMITTTITMEVVAGTPHVGELARIKATGEIHEVIKSANGTVTMSTGEQWVTTWTGRKIKIEGKVTVIASEVERVIVTNVTETETA